MTPYIILIDKLNAEQVGVFKKLYGPNMTSKLAIIKANEVKKWKWFKQISLN